MIKDIEDRTNLYDAKVEIEHVELWQADCLQCGWHTHQSDNKRWIEQLATWHKKNCPNSKPPRNGGTLQCGCWSYLMPGSQAGNPDNPFSYDTCPNGHNKQLIVACNVPDPAYPHATRPHQERPAP